VLDVVCASAFVPVLAFVVPAEPTVVQLVVPFSNPPFVGDCPRPSVTASRKIINTHDEIRLVEVFMTG